MDEWPADKIPGVYVICHSEKENTRFRRIIPNMIVRGIPKESLRFISPTWADNLDDKTIFNVYDPYLSRGHLPPFTFKAACLSKGEISLMLNFYSAIRHAIDNNREDQATLIFESDSYLRRDFVPRLNKILSDLSGTEWDYVSLGEGNSSRPSEAEKSYYGEQALYEPSQQWMFRSCESMLFSGKFLKRLVTTFLPFRECLDWELNFQLALHKGKALWADPPITEKGSTFGRQRSSD